jgi:hypothetical protein
MASVQTSKQAVKLGPFLPGYSLENAIHMLNGAVSIVGVPLLGGVEHVN